MYWDLPRSGCCAVGLIEQARFFVGGIQEPLDAKKKAGFAVIQQQFYAAPTLVAHPERAADAGSSRQCSTA